MVKLNTIIWGRLQYSVLVLGSCFKKRMPFLINKGNKYPSSVLFYLLISTRSYSLVINSSTIMYFLLDARVLILFFPVNVYWLQIPITYLEFIGKNLATQVPIGMLLTVWLSTLAIWTCCLSAFILIYHMFPQPMSPLAPLSASTLRGSLIEWRDYIGWCRKYLILLHLSLNTQAIKYF